LSSSSAAGRKNSTRLLLVFSTPIRPAGAHHVSPGLVGGRSTDFPSGKFKRGNAFKAHILTSKERSRKRKLKGTTMVSPQDTAKLRRMLPY